MSPIRRVIAERLSYAWAHIPHVHHHDTADVTELTRWIKDNNARRGERPKLTVTSFILKAVALMLRRHRLLNASLDAPAGEIIHKDYYHLGVAVDTERGLLVPVIRNADRKSVLAIAAEVDALAAKARAGKLTPDDMQGGTFTVTNLGGIGGTLFNPIINWPQAAILGVARSREEWVARGGPPAARLMLPLCLGYDHRLIDGAEAARAMVELVGMLAHPLDMVMDA
jgi:pyruvate dehydrogenase E2 component (dihydrolipoamide acetyltransferase)